MKRYLATIFGKDFNSMADLVKKHKIDILRQTVKTLDEDGSCRVDAILDSDQIQALKSMNYRIEIREDLEQTAKDRKKRSGSEIATSFPEQDNEQHIRPTG